MFSWTNKSVDLLLKLRREGLSADDIANKFAEIYPDSPSRNAVLGKLYRLKEPSPNSVGQFKGFYGKNRVRKNRG